MLKVIINYYTNLFKQVNMNQMFDKIQWSWWWKWAFQTTAYRDWISIMETPLIEINDVKRVAAKYFAVLMRVLLCRITIEYYWVY